MRIPLSATLMVLSATPLLAMSIDDPNGELKFSIKGQVQLRATSGSAKSPTGEDYDYLRGVEGSPEPLRLDLRRVRLGIEAKYGDGWEGEITIRSETNDQGVSEADMEDQRFVQLYTARAAKTFKAGECEHVARLGLDKAVNNSERFSSKQALFASDRPVDDLLSFRHVGVGYSFEAPIVGFYADFGNNGTKEKPAIDAQDVNNGMFYSARIEFMPGASWRPKKRMESFKGDEGRHCIIGFDYQVDQGKLKESGSATNNKYKTSTTTYYGPDLLLHFNALTLLAEYRWGDVDGTTVDNVGADVDASSKGRYFDIQAGYAIKTGPVILEPAVRFAIMDEDTEDDEEASEYNRGYDYDTPGSGRSWNLGLNCYFNGHSNKLQFEYQNWQAESGDAKASLFILQHQILF